MKKAFLIGIYSLFILNIYAATFKSNIIGQNLGEYNIGDDYYIIEKANNNVLEQTLFHNSQILKKTTSETINNEKIITIDYQDEQTKQTYLNNLLIKEEIGNDSYYYNYDKSNKLIKKVKLNKNGEQEIFLYLYNTDNKLISIYLLNKDNYKLFTYEIVKNSQSLSISEKDSYKESQIHNGVINSLEYKNDQILKNIEITTEKDNEIILTQKDDKFIYKEFFKDGMLIKKEQYNLDNYLIKKEEFFYNQNYIKTKDIITEKIYNKFTREYDTIKETTTIYSNNNIDNVSIKENGKLISSYYYENNKKIENLYDNNILYCTVIYENNKIIDIQYREGSDDL